MNKGEIGFEGVISNFATIIKNIDNRKIQDFRWFQEKTYDIVCKNLKDYTILYIDKYIVIIASFIEFVMKTQEGNEVSSCYYFPLLIKGKQDNMDYLCKYVTNSDTVYVYDAVDDINYIRCMDALLLNEKSISFKSGGRLVPYNLLSYSVYSSERLSNKSSNSLTLLNRNEIMKTFRRMVPGLNPDLEMNVKLKKNGFQYVQDIRGYFVYIDHDNNLFTISMVTQYIDNVADMWQYTQKYLENFINLYKGEDITISYILEKCDDYLKEIKDISKMIAQMHVNLSRIKDKNFEILDPSYEEIEEISSGIINNFNLLLNYIKCNSYDDELNNIVNCICDSKEFLYNKMNDIDKYIPYFGKYIRCHGDLHLEQILKTNNGYVLIDFEGEPTKPMYERKRHLSPLKDIAGMIRSFNYAAYAAYFDYKDKQKDKSNLNSIESLLTLWAKVVTGEFVNNYISIIKQNTPEIMPDDAHLSTILALYKLDKVLFEALYEVNNRPTWVKIPLMGIMECINGLKNNDLSVEVNYG